MASVDVLNARMTAQLQVYKHCLRPTWMYFTMYYPGANSGNIVQETGIEFGNQLPGQNYRATTLTTTKLNDDDTYDNIKFLVVHINMGEIESALKAEDSYSAVHSVFRNSILDTEALTGRKNTLSDNEYSFRFVFHAQNHMGPSRDIRLLLITRWALFSNMHNWQPKAGIEGMKQCIVVPTEDHMSEWLAAGGKSSARFDREIKPLLESNPSEYISPHSIKRRFWLEEAYSSHLWLCNQMAQQSPTSSIARLEIFDSVSPRCVQIAEWKARRSAQNVPCYNAEPTPPATPTASDYQTARSRQSQIDSSPDDRNRTRSSSPTPILQRMQCNRCDFRSA